MQRQVAALWQRHRVATLFVTHDVEEALLLADRILLIEAGHIARQFDISLTRPRHRDHPQFVALRKELLANLGVDAEDLVDVSVMGKATSARAI
jgi:sulfonate transport system ATP-binding protein